MDKQFDLSRFFMRQILFCTRSILSNSVISHSNFSLANLTTVTVNNQTRIKGVELIGRMGSDDNKVWAELRSNSELVEFLLSQMDSNLRDIIIRDNPNLRSSE
jgi:hypothetical protein